MTIQRNGLALCYLLLTLTGCTAVHQPAHRYCGEEQFIAHPVVKQS